MVLAESFVFMAGIFLLGTYAVSTLDDILHMRASASFVYVWILMAALFGYWQYQDADPLLYARIIAAAVIFAAFKFGVPHLGFRLATGDCVAMLPVVFLFPPIQVAVFVAGFMIADRVILKTLYVTLMKRSFYPFMPALIIGLALVLSLAKGGVV